MTVGTPHPISINKSASALHSIGDIEPIRPVRVSALYRVGLVFGALASVLLPFLYLLLVTMLGYGVFYHAARNVHFLDFTNGVALAIAMTILYLIPLFAGVILIFFLIKPLFTTQFRLEKPRQLKREEAPGLFLLAEKICQAVNAPLPDRIDIDFQANASAQLKAGLGMFLSRRLILTVGLPLAAGMNQRQLAGVLAHEFGHFSQGFGMRLSYIIRQINTWFFRVVYERDRFDERLLKLYRRQSILMRPIWGVALVGVEIARRILWVFMMIGHAINAYLMRQMEYDADRYEARLVGADTFEKIFHEMLELNKAVQTMRQDLAQAWQERRLSDDLNVHILTNVQELPTSARREIKESFTRADSRWYDTHPSVGERLDRIWREAPRGVYRSDRPAAELFADFEALSRQATLGFYRDAIGADFTPRHLVSSHILIERRRKLEEDKKVAKRYFQGLLSMIHPPRLQEFKLWPPQSLEAMQRSLKATRQPFESIMTMIEVRKVLVKIHESEVIILRALQASALISAGLRNMDKEDYGLDELTNRGAKDAYDKAMGQQYRVRREMEEFETSLSLRLRTALEMLQIPELRHQLPDAPNLLKEARELLPVLQPMTETLESIRDIRHELVIMVTLLEQLSKQQHNPKLAGKVQAAASNLYQQLLGLKDTYKEIKNPLEHGGEASAFIGRYLVGEMRESEGYSGLVLRGQETLDRFFMLYFRILGRLAAIAEKVEESQGIKPLPDPPDPETTF